LTGTRSIITVVVSIGLGGSLSAALNALGPVLAAGGGRVALCSRPIGSLDVVSVIEDDPNLKSVGVRSILFPSLRLGSTIVRTVGRVRASIDALLMQKVDLQTQRANTQF